MDLHEGFEAKGFRCEGVENGVGSICEENAEWFKLAEDTNAVLMRAATAAMNAVNTSSMTSESVAVRVLLRSCGLFQGVLFLTERGMVAESRTLARSLLESAFCIAMMNENPDRFMEMLKEDSNASRKQQGKFIIAQDLIEGSAARDKLEATIADLGKAQLMSTKKIAKLGATVHLYLSYQRLSDDSVHLSAKSLDRHVQANEDRSGWQYRWGTGTQDENAATLHHTILAALTLGVGITQMLEDVQGNAAFNALSERFRAMPPVSVV